MIGRLANSLKRVVEPTATWAAALGAVTLGVMVVMLIVSVIMRKAFNAPMKGVFEMTEFGMVMITFLCMSAQYFKPDAMVMETFVEMLPKKMQVIICNRADRAIRNGFFGPQSGRCIACLVVTACTGWP